MTPQQLQLPRQYEVPPYLRVDTSVSVIDTDERRGKADRDAQARAEALRERMAKREGERDANT